MKKGLLMFTLLAASFPVRRMRIRGYQTVAGEAGRTEHRYSASPVAG
jgi:hypothetical protein